MNSLQLKNIFTGYFPGDTIKDNYPRQVISGLYSEVAPKTMSSPEMIIYNDDIISDLQLDESYVKSKDFLNLVSGNVVQKGIVSYAMNYGGHQFGHWAGQLGDGRAINLGEIMTDQGIQTIHLKGAGPTPYSRTADGFAVLRSSIREFLCSEAMYHLHVPTTRALALVSTGEQVLRDVMYDGNADYEKGAVLARIAPSFIRFGNFEIWASRRNDEFLKSLADYTIEYHYPHLKDKPAKYLSLFEEITNKTCDMVAEWQRVGFVHGVMNTDNMSVLGLTIDYGPYGWLDNYDPNWTPNTTDLPGRRYRFGNQPVIAQWNLLQLANALYPLIQDKDALKQIIEDFGTRFTEKYQSVMRAKLGLFSQLPADVSLVKRLEQVMFICNMDYTIFFRLLGDINAEMTSQEARSLIEPALYNELIDAHEDLLIAWLETYLIRLKQETVASQVRKSEMSKVNPKYVLRNYMAQLAIEAAESGDYSLIHEIYTMLKHPYDEQPEFHYWFAKRPEWAMNKVGCSMLSCSS